MTLSVLRLYRESGGRMADEVEWIQKETAVAKWRYYIGTCFEGLRKTT
jgi:hypothetical protein